MGKGSFLPFGLGGMVTGLNGSSSKPPAGYQPTWQAGADQGIQQTAQNLMPWAQGMPGQVIPGLQGVVNNVQNNPYYPGAQQGANDVSALAGGTVAPGMMNAAGSLYDQGLGQLGSGQFSADMLRQAGDASNIQGQDLAARAQGNIYGRAMDMLPGATLSGFKNADPFYKQGMQKANTLWDQTQMAIPHLTGGMPEAQQLLNNGFDPQSQLYDREFQKMQDQQNAINAMYGVSGSAYGAGVAGDASRNFNMDWQDRSLGRQLSALQGFGGHQASVTGNLTNLLGTGAQGYDQLSQGAVNGFNNLLNGSTNRASQLLGVGAQGLETASTVYNRGVDNQRLNYGTGAQIIDTMNRGATDMLGAGSAHAADALNTLYTSTQLPNQTYLQNQDAQIAALQALAQGGNTAMQPSFNLMQTLNDYMRTGQSATVNAQNANQIRAQQQQASMQGLMSLAGLALAPMTGGMSLFGSGAGARG